jgi:dTMP kinase
LAFHERLRAGFLQIAEAEPQRCRVIDAEAGIDEVAAAIWAAVCDRFGLTP